MIRLLATLNFDDFDCDKCDNKNDNTISKSQRAGVSFGKRSLEYHSAQELPKQTDSRVRKGAVLQKPGMVRGHIYFVWSGDRMETRHSVD